MDARRPGPASIAPGNTAITFAEV
ncbi:MAG: hypothetical protein K0S99_1282, partial [Thermomicrobiales bacterium]|nr:hypothetical protein [Thermomicrobiales bacterium]